MGEPHSPEIVAHEMGHHIEMNNPQVLAACVKYRADRVEKAKKKGKDVVLEQLPNPPHDSGKYPERIADMIMMGHKVTVQKEKGFGKLPDKQIPESALIEIWDEANQRVAKDYGIVLEKVMVRTMKIGSGARSIVEMSENATKKFDAVKDDFYKEYPEFDPDRIDSTDTQPDESEQSDGKQAEDEPVK